MQSGASDSVAAQGGMISAAALSGGAGTLTVEAQPKPAGPKFKMRSKEIGFQILAGAAQTLLPSLEAGATGSVLAFGACAPTACFEVYTAWKENDRALAELKQNRISEAAKRMAGFGVPGVKYAMDLNGYYGGPARLPLLPLTGDEKTEIEELMADIKN
jgi:dihydrodipicolinate synthase/N-acetylneuraminate lyase